MELFLGILIIIVVIGLAAKLIEVLTPAFHGAVEMSVALWDNKMFILGLLFILAALFFIRLFQTSSGFDFFIKFNFRARGKKLEPKNRPSDKLPPGNIVRYEKSDQKFVDGDYLKPIDDVNIEEFARHASQYFNNPAKFNDFLTGWWHRSQLNKNVETVEKLNTLLIKMREASTSARELQEEIIKNRVIFRYQAEIALERLKDDWETEKLARQLEKLRIETEKRRQEMMANFYSGLNLANLSESSLMTLAMLNPKESTKQFQSGDSMVFSKESFTDPANLANIGFQKKMSEALYQEIMTNLDLKKAETEIKRGQARQEHSQADLDSETVKANIIKLKEKFNAPAGNKPGS